MSYNKETGLYEGYIYCITNNVNGKQYIGQTSTTIGQRFIGHRYRAKHDSNQYIHNAMRSYGIENFIVKEVKCISNGSLSDLCNELDKLESYYISLYNTLNPNGYNNTVGGRQNDGFQIKERKVFQFSLQGDLIDEYNNLKEAADITGFDKTGISKCCLLETHSSYGYVWRYEDTLQDYNGYVSHWITKNETHNNLILSGQHILRGILQFDLNGNLIKQHDDIHCVVSFNKDIHILPECVYKCCYGKNYTHQGFVWRFVGDDFYKFPIKDTSIKNKENMTKSVDTLKKRTNLGIPIEMLSVEGQIIKKFSNIKIAAEYVKGDPSTIIKCCKGSYKTHKGYKWRYAVSL